jgi:hypothetical protein
MSSMSHNNGVVTNLESEHASQFEEFPPYDNEVHNPHPIKPMVIITLLNIL